MTCEYVVQTASRPKPVLAFSDLLFSARQASDQRDHPLGVGGCWWQVADIPRTFRGLVVDHDRPYRTRGPPRWSSYSTPQPKRRGRPARTGRPLDR